MDVESLCTDWLELVVRGLSQKIVFVVNPEKWIDNFGGKNKIVNLAKKISLSFLTLVVGIEMFNLLDMRTTCLGN